MLWIVIISIIVLGVVIFGCFHSYQKFEKIKQNLIQSIDDLKQQEQKYQEAILDYQSELYAAFKDAVTAEEKYKQEKEIKFAEIDQEFADRKKNLENEIQKTKDTLQKMTNTLQARLAANRREEEIKENKEQYCLNLTLNDENDIKMLNELKPKLHNPRILSMLIWQTYFQKPLTSLCTKNVGAAAKTGIYKITNQVTGECYIGQAVSIQDRWKEHAKCGLGIDTPVGNKLYKSMLEYGLQNFSWEVLEICTKADLDEKEAYYIDAYQSKDFGLNTLAGRNVKK